MILSFPRRRYKQYFIGLENGKSILIHFRCYYQHIGINKLNKKYKSIILMTVEVGDVL